MFISKAYAQAEELASDILTEIPVDAPSATEAFMMNMALIAVLVLLFYVLMIRPQQKRMKEHNGMLSGLAKGTKIVTQGGIVATVEKIMNDHEMKVNVDGTTLIILRSAVMSTYAEAIPQGSSVANDDKATAKKDKPVAKKTTTKAKSKTKTKAKTKTATKKTAK